MRRILASIFALLLLIGGQCAYAVIQINEVYFSPEDPAEDRQFFEIISTTGATSLSNLWFLEIEGDEPIGGAQLDNPGTVLNAFDLSTFSTGTNGLFLWRDSATVIDTSNDPGIQGPDAATVVHVEAFTQVFGYEETIGEDDDEEVIYANNVHTFLLVSSFTGVVGDDLDGNDNGILDSLPWSGVLDGISQSEAGDAGHRYAAQVGGEEIGLWFGADVFQRRPSDGMWMLFDSGSGDGEPAGFQGPFYANDGDGPGDSDAGFEDGTEIAVRESSTYLYATPGAANVQVPEPAAGVLTALACLCGFVRRSR